MRRRKMKVGKQANQILNVFLYTSLTRRALTQAVPSSVVS